MTRPYWRDFICSSDHPGRHLAPIGRSFSRGISDAIDLDVLRQFLESVDGENKPEMLASVVDLISGDYKSFCKEDLPKILDALASEAVSYEAIVGPGLRGSPRWEKTILGRKNGTLSRSQFVVDLKKKSFEVPENRLVLWLLNDLATAVTEIERTVGSNALHPDLAEIRALSDSGKLHNWMAQIRLRELTPQLIRAAEVSRNPSYRLAAKLARRRWEALTGAGEAWWYTTLSLLAVNWLEPVDDDDLFELYVLVLVIDILAKEFGLGTPAEFGLIVRNRRHVALFSGDGVEVRVYFDQSMHVICGSRSAYADVVASHVGLSGAERRPDIVISVRRGELTTWHLVEIKRSADGRYLSDSVYKVFGYMYDQFGSSARFESALLVVPTGVNANSWGSLASNVHVVSGDSRPALVQAIARALKLNELSSGD